MLSRHAAGLASLAAALTTSCHHAVTRSPPQRDAAATEHWSGGAVFQGAQLPVMLDFTRISDSTHGALSAPTLGVLDYPLASVIHDSLRVGFQATTDGGATMFEGTRTRDTIAGQWRIAGLPARLTVTLSRAPNRPYDDAEVRFPSRGVSLAGTLMIPSTRGPHPAIVFLHGSGASNRWAFRYLGDQFARRGIAALVFDKRGVGGSGGACCQADFDDLAADALAAVRFLKTRRDVLRDRIALLGQSQGGRIAAMAAARSPDVAFVIAVSSALDTPAEQNLYQSQQMLAVRGYPDDTVRRVTALEERMNEYFRTGAGRGDLEHALRSAQKSDWYKLADLPDSLPLEALRAKSWWFRHLDLDPREAWNRVRVPVLAVYGAEDRNSDLSQNLARLEAAFATSSNTDHTTRVFPQAGHDLRIAPRRGQPFNWPHYPAGYPDDVIEWLCDRACVR